MFVESDLEWMQCFHALVCKESNTANDSEGSKIYVFECNKTSETTERVCSEKYCHDVQQGSSTGGRISKL